jgi:hypothetical protein
LTHAFGIEPRDMHRFLHLLCLCALGLFVCRTGFAQDSRTAVPSTRGVDHTHALLTRVLEKHVRGDRFDYAGLKAARGDLDLYFANLAAVTPEAYATWTREQRFAFWINAYNANALDLIVRNYPLKSIEDLSTPTVKVWKLEFISLDALRTGGKRVKYSLDEIENNILRPEFKDARVHAAINCASESCPPLRQEAYVAERLDAQLEQQMRKFVSDATRNRIDAQTSTLELSSIFDWFAEDFEHDAGSVLAYVRKYLAAGAAEMDWILRAKPRFLDYSWKLNDATKQGEPPR